MADNVGVKWASQAAVAIENARLYETISSNEVRLEKEIRFAQRVQVALLPTDLPKRIKGVDVGAQPLEEIYIAPDGSGFSGFLALPPGAEDRLFVHYLDEPEIEVRGEDLEPPLLV